MKHQIVGQLAKNAYTSSKDDFAQWMWQHHVQLVAQKTEELSHRFKADEDLAVAGAWLHDFGDAFVNRHADSHGVVSVAEGTRVLISAGYDQDEINEILNMIIKPHSCREGDLPTTLEGKVLATADALAHLTTDFYVQFAWKHLPENKTYIEYVAWVNEKIDRDFNQKIFFEDVRSETRRQYEALKVVFSQAGT